MTQHQWQLGKYTIGKRIGGGMTSVHLATNTSTNTQVVLKLIADADEDAPEKIHAEERGAEIQQRLAMKDTRIPKVYEWGHLEGHFYIEMEYVNGRPLDKTGKLGSGLAVTIATDVCEVLELAHSEDIIHGDIKPGNILDVTSDSDKTQRTTIKLLDFGVSRFTTSATRNHFRSVPYCSPEVRQGADHTRMDDLWSLCVSIYELVEGRLPFSSAGKPLFTEDSRSPADLRFILQKMFAPDLRNRYQTASQLKTDLLAFQSGKPFVHQPVPVSSAPTARTPSSNPRLQTQGKLVIAMLALILLAALALIFAGSANTMLNFTEAVDSARPDNAASILEGARTYKDLASYGGLPRLLTHMTSNAPRKLRDASMAFAARTMTRYARELDLPEKGNVSEREWKAAMDVLAAGADIDENDDLRAMMAYVTGHYHRINAESRIGMAANAERKKTERVAGLDHYTQAETYFNEALNLKPEWTDAQFGLVRLYASVFPEMDKAETAITRANRENSMTPLRLQFEMALGHHWRAAELNRTVMESLRSLAREKPGPPANLSIESARKDLDMMDAHMRRALAYYDSCLDRGACWDARFRRTRVGSLMVASDAQRTLLGEMELRLRIPAPQDNP